ncbi:Exocyst complex component 7 [Quaeritorhiza haematococci]|nr:Exocyst complex component 7 [Quaeritorhiza haematococci]
MESAEKVTDTASAPQNDTNMTEDKPVPSGASTPTIPAKVSATTASTGSDANANIITTTDMPNNFPYEVGSARLIFLFFHYVMLVASPYFDAIVANSIFTQKFTRVNMSWLQLVHLAMYNILLRPELVPQSNTSSASATPILSSDSQQQQQQESKENSKREFVRWKEQLCSFIDEYWEYFYPAKARTPTWQNTVASCLSTHNKIFKSGVEKYKQQGWWGLREMIPPPPPKNLSSKPRIRQPRSAKTSGSGTNVDEPRKMRKRKEQGGDESQPPKKRSRKLVAAPEPVAPPENAVSSDGSDSSSSSSSDGDTTPARTLGDIYGALGLKLSSGKSGRKRVWSRPASEIPFIPPASMSSSMGALMSMMGLLPSQGASSSSSSDSDDDSSSSSSSSSDSDSSSSSEEEEQLRRDDNRNKKGKKGRTLVSASPSSSSSDSSTSESENEGTKSSSFLDVNKKQKRKLTSSPGPSSASETQKRNGNGSHKTKKAKTELGKSRKGKEVAQPSSRPKKQPRNVEVGRSTTGGKSVGPAGATALEPVAGAKHMAETDEKEKEDEQEEEDDMLGSTDKSHDARPDKGGDGQGGAGGAGGQSGGSGKGWPKGYDRGSGKGKGGTTKDSNQQGDNGNGNGIKIEVMARTLKGDAAVPPSGGAGVTHTFEVSGGDTGDRQPFPDLVSLSGIPPPPASPSQPLDRPGTDGGALFGDSDSVLLYDGPHSNVVSDSDENIQLSVIPYSGARSRVQSSDSFFQSQKNHHLGHLCIWCLGCSCPGTCQESFLMCPEDPGPTIVPDGDAIQIEDLGVGAYSFAAPLVVDKMRITNRFRLLSAIRRGGILTTSADLIADIGNDDFDTDIMSPLTPDVSDFKIPDLDCRSLLWGSTREATRRERIPLFWDCAGAGAESPPSLLSEVNGGWTEKGGSKEGGRNRRYGRADNSGGAGDRSGDVGSGRGRDFQRYDEVESEGPQIGKREINATPNASSSDELIGEGGNDDDDDGKSDNEDGRNGTFDLFDSDSLSSLSSVDTDLPSSDDEEDDDVVSGTDAERFRMVLGSNENRKAVMKVFRRKRHRRESTIESSDADEGKHRVSTKKKKESRSDDQQSKPHRARNREREKKARTQARAGGANKKAPKVRALPPADEFGLLQQLENAHWTWSQRIHGESRNNQEDIALPGQISVGEAGGHTELWTPTHARLRRKLMLRRLQRSRNLPAFDFDTLVRSHIRRPTQLQLSQTQQSATDTTSKQGSLEPAAKLGAGADGQQRLSGATTRTLPLSGFLTLMPPAIPSYILDSAVNSSHSKPRTLQKQPQSGLPGSVAEREASVADSNDMLTTKLLVSKSRWWIQRYQLVHHDFTIDVVPSDIQITSSSQVTIRTTQHTIGLSCLGSTVGYLRGATARRLVLALEHGKLASSIKRKTSIIGSVAPDDAYFEDCHYYRYDPLASRKSSAFSPSLSVSASFEHVDAMDIDTTLKNMQIECSRYPNRPEYTFTYTPMTTLQPRMSSWTGKILKPYIWRDYESRPPRMRTYELIKARRTLDSFDLSATEASSSIDYVHFQPMHLKQVNEALCRQFWPGIDVSENLLYPDFTIVALYKRVIVGCAFMTPECYVTYIMVRPGWNGAGIGRFMLYYLIQAAGGRDITLHVSANNPAMLLYQSFGFKPEEFIVGFYDKYLPSESQECKNAKLAKMVFMESAPFNEAQTERRRELERKLEEDMEELQLYQSSLLRTNELTQKMIGMLSSFDHRLVKLESSIFPIHRATQKLTKGLDKGPQISRGPDENDIGPYLKSMGKLKDALRFLSQTNYNASERAIIQLKEVYQTGLKNLDDLFRKWLVECSKPVDAAALDNGVVPTIPENTLKNLQTLATQLAASDFMNSIRTRNAGTGISATISNTTGSANQNSESGITASSTAASSGGTGGISLVTTLSNALGNEISMANNFVRTYIEVRSQFLIRSLADLATQAGQVGTASGSSAATVPATGEGKRLGALSSATLSKSPSFVATSGGADRMPTGKPAAYQKGSCPLLPYTRVLLKLLKAERDLLQKLVPKVHATSGTFQMTVGPAIDAYLVAGDGLVGRIKRTTISRREFSTADGVYMLMDMIECLSTGLKEYDGVLTYAGLKGNDINDLLSTCKSTVMLYFKEFYEDIKNDDAKQSSLSVDGTVHELTSTTLNTLKRLLDYTSTVDQMLADGWGVTAALPVTTFASFMSDVIEALTTNLESKAKGYTKSKQPTLGVVFLLNNYHYIYKTIHSQTRLLQMLGPGVDEKYSKLVTKQKEAYQDSWKPLVEHLMDQTYIQGGVIQKTLTKAQREIVKDKFKDFNTDFEDTMKAQKAWAVPDAELRAALIKDVKQVLLPMYGRFYDRYNQIEFSKNPTKYMKYDKQSLGAALDKFFDASA